ncbi:hypothetical protein KAR91_80440 [Candidatus Pacearchaeota archaeon]|nr:hypothetical protein [Candidatus Pacearchaeota archaeon]
MNSNTPSNTPTVRHLDSEYRRRWELYTTPDQVYDSREVNWREVPWEEVIELKASVEGHEYTVDNSGPGFQSFIRWRWGGFHNNGAIPINVWCIGWTDGVTCFMKEIEFKDGSMTEKEYPFEQFKKHLGDYND